VREPQHARKVGATARQPGADVVGRHRRLVLRTFLVSALTLASRLLGYLRESLAAALFGDRSAINDAFVTAWRVPNLFRGLMGEGAIAAAMQTAITRADAEQGEDAGRRLFQALLRVVIWLSAGFTVVGIAIVVLLPDTMPLTGWRWLGADPGPVRDLTARMLPFVVLACVAAVATGALHVRGHFLAPSLGPVVMNVAWVSALVWVASRHAADFVSGAPSFERQLDMARELALLVLACGALLVLVQLPALRARGLIGGRDGRAGAADRRAVWAILRDSAPLALGAAVYQVNGLIAGFMAEGLLADGGPTALYYATRLQQLPLSLVSVAATSAVFPSLAALGHVRDLGGLRKLHDDTHGAIAFLAIPATVGLLVFAEPIVALCFHHGAFGEHGVERTADALRGLTLAILPAGAAGLVARTRYALGDFLGPVRIAVGVLFLNTILNWALVRWAGMDAAGLALAAALAAWANLALLLPGLRGLGLPPARAGWVGRTVLQTGLALLACGAAWVVWWLAREAGHGPLGLGGAILCAVAVYGGASILVGAPEARRLVQTFRAPRN
jgi:putative peptidoglycan lipid II flippase